jgi:hypothetical protein
MLETLRASKSGEAGREYSVRLTIDLSDSLPSTIRSPNRAKKVRPAPPRHVRVAGMVWEYPAVAVAQVVATVTVFGSRGEEPPIGMNRSTWFLPVENDETREKQAHEQRDYVTGKQAFEPGAPPSVCPHVGDLRAAWERGWVAASRRHAENQN